MTCFACEREPVQQCSRCGRPYCEDHGEELCEVCLQPASGVPSFSLYRGSLLALLIGTALAVWLLVQPTGSSSETLRPVVLTPTAGAARAPTTPGAEQTPAATNQTPGAAQTTPGAATTPGAQTTPRPSGTTAATPRGTTAAPTATPVSGGATYTVRGGDTLGGICSAQRPSLSNPDCVDQLKRLNNLTSDDISIGDTLRLP